jgi:hypothetical protein
MDETRFDSVHALDAVRPRRGLMSLLGGMTLGGTLASLLRSSEAGARKSVRNAKKKKKAAKLIPGPQGAPGAQGPQGPPGAQGPAGPAGRFTCPRDTLIHLGVCIETSKRNSGNSSEFAAAQTDCLNAGGRLPTPAELQTFRTLGETDFDVAEYTGFLWLDSGLFFAMTVNNLGTQVPEDVTAPFPYRCVAPPT